MSKRSPTRMLHEYPESANFSVRLPGDDDSDALRLEAGSWIRGGTSGAQTSFAGLLGEIGTSGEDSNEDEGLGESHVRSPAHEYPAFHSRSKAAETEDSSMEVWFQTHAGGTPGHDSHTSRGDQRKRVNCVI